MAACQADLRDFFFGARSPERPLPKSANNFKVLELLPPRPLLSRLAGKLDAFLSRKTPVFRKFMIL